MKAEELARIISSALLVTVGMIAVYKAEENGVYIIGAGACFTASALIIQPQIKQLGFNKGVSHEKKF